MNRTESKTGDGRRAEQKHQIGDCAKQERDTDVSKKTNHLRASEARGKESVGSERAGAGRAPLRARPAPCGPRAPGC